VFPKRAFWEPCPANPCSPGCARVLVKARRRRADLAMCPARAAVVLCFATFVVVAGRTSAAADSFSAGAPPATADLGLDPAAGTLGPGPTPWRTASPEAHGVSLARLAVRRGRRLPFISSYTCSSLPPRPPDPPPGLPAAK
jgi:hypothetical protein